MTCEHGPDDNALPHGCKLRYASIAPYWENNGVDTQPNMVGTCRQQGWGVLRNYTLQFDHFSLAGSSSFAAADTNKAVLSAS